MTSVYLKCDGCGAVLDRRPKDDHTGSRERWGGGTFRGQGALLEHAKSLGWYLAALHYCPSCAPVVAP